VGGRPLDPSDSLNALNQAILDQRTDDRFITAVLARLTVGDDGPVIRLSNGGHPHPLLARADGTVEETGPAGTLLGVFAEPNLVSHRLELGPGDALIMFTDGLKERRNPELEPTTRMVELLRTASSLPADEIAARLGGLAQSAGEEADDDVAILVLRRSA
jgi:serine phosphatase RsbU (regulator of sigma subunit)